MEGNQREEKGMKWNGIFPREEKFAALFFSSSHSYYGIRAINLYKKKAPVQLAQLLNDGEMSE